MSCFSLKTKLIDTFNKQIFHILIQKYKKGCT